MRLLRGATHDFIDVEAAAARLLLRVVDAYLSFLFWRTPGRGGNIDMVADAVATARWWLDDLTDEEWGARAERSRDFERRAALNALKNLN